MFQIARLQEAIVHDLARQGSSSAPYLALYLDREKAFTTLANPLGFHQIENLLGQCQTQRTVSVCLVFPKDDDEDSKDTIEIYRLSSLLAGKLTFIASRMPAGHVEYRLFDGVKIVLGDKLESFLQQDKGAHKVLSLFS